MDWSGILGVAMALGGSILIIALVFWGAQTLRGFWAHGEALLKADLTRRATRLSASEQTVDRFVPISPKREFKVARRRQTKGGK